MLDITETLERLQNDRQFLATVVLTMFFLAIFPIYFSSAGGAGDGSMSAVADYTVEGELEYIELDNATEYIFDGETLELSFTTEVLDDASSKNIVGVEVSMSYDEDESNSGGIACIGPNGGQNAADTISATATHDSYNGSGDGQNSGGSGAHSVEVIWQNVSLLNPVLYLISGFRYSFYEVSDVSLITSIITIFTILICCVLFISYTFIKGYKIKE